MFFKETSFTYFLSLTLPPSLYLSLFFSPSHFHSLSFYCPLSFSSPKNTFLFGCMFPWQFVLQGKQLSGDLLTGHWSAFPFCLKHRKQVGVMVDWRTGRGVNPSPPQTLKTKWKRHRCCTAWNTGLSNHTVISECSVEVACGLTVTSGFYNPRLTWVTGAISCKTMVSYSRRKWLCT